MGVVYNKGTNHLHAYRHLLTNRLNDKTAELYLAKSLNNNVTTTTYIKYISGIHSMYYSFHHMC